MEDFVVFLNQTYSSVRTVVMYYLIKEFEPLLNVVSVSFNSNK